MARKIRRAKGFLRDFAALGTMFLVGYACILVV